MLFSCLFGGYFALRSETFNGPGPLELFHMDLVLIMTMLLLTSSLTSVLAIWAMQSNQLRKMQGWFVITVLLGLGFLGFEVYEFFEYAQDGLVYTTSPFATAFYTLVGFHGGHVLFGICWFIVLLIQSAKNRLDLIMAPKFFLASLYWHFVDVVWVFIFTAVYLMGMVS